MSNPQISIIVPVYKAEKYIHRCIDSILAQTFTNFELLLIDDGSPDQSGAICDEYAAKDSRIRVFHKENGGVASARQAGLDAASGEYVIHADPDDWVEPNWLECLYDKAKGDCSDMVICDFTRHYVDHISYCNQCPTSANCADIAEDLICERIWGSTWNKLIRRSCFKDYNISFVTTMSLWEDLYVTCALIQHNIKVSYLNKSLYNYDCCTNENSIVRFRTIEHIHSFFTFINHFQKIFDAPRYEDGWYFRKCIVKRAIYRLKNSDCNLRQIYSEVNDRYIVENENSHLWSEEFYIVLCLKGIPLWMIAIIANFVVTISKWKRYVLNY